jgi:hypothetical protein
MPKLVSRALSVCWPSGVALRTYKGPQESCRLAFGALVVLASTGGSDRDQIRLDQKSDRDQIRQRTRRRTVNEHIED